ncbi:hypothetical protein TUM4433_25830 [Shewanella schlegeliana]|nr:hypothetical protein TUM4433_25830 [Shewanella schlegeliana]
MNKIKLGRYLTWKIARGQSSLQLRVQSGLSQGLQSASGSLYAVKHLTFFFITDVEANFNAKNDNAAV